MRNVSRYFQKPPYQEEMTLTRNVRNRRRVNEGSLGVEI